MGANASKADEDLGYEFLRRLAKFIKDEGIKPIPPFIANISRLLGDVNEEVDICDYCNADALEFLHERVYTRCF